jgi:hypothetical protein
MVLQIVVPPVFDLHLQNNYGCDGINSMIMLQSNSPLTMEKKSHPSQQSVSSSQQSFKNVRPRARFPLKLRAVLNDAAVEGNEHILSWLPNGKAFKVHKPDLFASKLMKRYFRQSHFRSFTRQVRSSILPLKPLYTWWMFPRQVSHDCCPCLVTILPFSCIIMASNDANKVPFLIPSFNETMSPCPGGWAVRLRTMMRCTT